MFRRTKKLSQLTPPKNEEPQSDGTCFLDSLKANTDFLQHQFGAHSDLSIRFMDEADIAIAYIESLVDSKTIETHIIEEINRQKQKVADNPIEELTISTKKLTFIDTSQKLIEFLLQGYTVILKEGESKAAAAATSGGEERAVSESSNESVVRGPRDAFNESLMTNIGLIRKRLHTEKLRIYKCKLGKLSNTSVAIVYIESVAKEEIFKKSKLAWRKLKLMEY